MFVCLLFVGLFVVFVKKLCLFLFLFLYMFCLFLLLLCLFLFVFCLFAFVVVLFFVGFVVVGFLVCFLLCGCWFFWGKCSTNLRKNRFCLAVFAFLLTEITLFDVCFIT